MTSRQTSQQAGSRSMRAVICAALFGGMFHFHRRGGAFRVTVRCVRMLENSRAAFCKRLSWQFNIQLVQIRGLQVREPLRGIEESSGFLG